MKPTNKMYADAIRNLQYTFINTAAPGDFVRELIGAVRRGNTCAAIFVVGTLLQADPRFKHR